MNRLALVLVIATSLAACQPRTAGISAQASPAWAYADLRALDPPDAPTPSQDIVALYTRAVRGEIQIRLDLLDLTTDLDYDLYLALDAAPGGTTTLPLDAAADIAWDALLTIPASGALTMFYPNERPIPKPKLHVFRDPFLDTVVVSFDRAALPTPLPFTVQAFAAPAGSKLAADTLGPARSDAPPPARAPVLIAFWNTFPAATPAQALRAWDGAHSGPGRSRHGLKHLLDAVAAMRVPIALLDLKNPASLVALDYIGALPRLRDLAARGWLSLPDTTTLAPTIYYRQGQAHWLPEGALAETNALDRQVSRQLGLPASNMLFAPYFLTRTSADYDLILHPTLYYSYRTISVEKWGHQFIIHIPAYSGWENADSGLTEANEATVDGLSLKARRALLVTVSVNASSSAPTRLMLGGDLSLTAWGEPEAARHTMMYLAAHPWIQILTPDDLFFSSPNTVSSQAPAYLRGMRLHLVELHEKILDALSQSPPSTITDTAWQMYEALASPAPSQLAGLRGAYLGQVGHLLAAARWAENPTPRSDCLEDLDWDGQPECLLASDDFFAVFERDGGRLTVAFARTPTGIHQIITPSYQFAVGLSDPMEWDPARGVAADPSAIPGAFSDNLHTWDVYQTAVSPGQITFVSPDGALQKTITLVPGGLRAEYRSASPLLAQIPLGIDAWERFTPGWGDRYREESTPEGWSWGLARGPRVEITTSGSLTTRAFTASRAALQFPEDPNFDYGAGHLLPFPLAVAEVYGREFSVEILVVP